MRLSNYVEQESLRQNVHQYTQSNNLIRVFYRTILHYYNTIVSLT